MGVTKQYLRYVPSATFNVIASGGCNLCFVVLQGQQGRFLAVAACEDVIVWDMRLGEKALVLQGDKSEATCLCPSPDRVHLAVGYTDGKISLYNLITGENVSVFCGHRASISALHFDELGHRLVSGGKDTEIVTWDIVAESGLSRLSGHKGAVTAVSFLRSKNVVVSASKDTYIKLWDLDVNHCFHTIAAHITEVWCLTILGDDEYLVAGSNDSELRMWSLNEQQESEEQTGNKLENEEFYGGLNCAKVGSILRAGSKRVVSMVSDETRRVLCVHGVDSTIEVFQILDKQQAALRAKKRIAKLKKKASLSGAELPPPVNPEERGVTLRDIVKRLPIVKATGKVKSVDIVMGHDELRIAVSLAKNRVELYCTRLDGIGEPKLLRKIAHYGHEGEVRAVAFSSDNLAIASVGTSSVKMWNRLSLGCLRTVNCGYALSVCFVPGDRHVLVGLKSGALLIVDLSAGDILEEIPAHTTELWSITLTPDKSSVVTCSGDSTVKVWRFELVSVASKRETKKTGDEDEDEDEDSGAISRGKVLSVVHTRTLKLNDPVLAVKVSPCGRYVIAALLDSTVKIFFMDTFKFFLSMYGHQMPVLCLDVSYDSSLVVTGSADRNIKIWGLDFGDCHRSLFAHDDSVTAVAFIPQTHYFFSVGKDGAVKQWDADTFERIITLKGHFGEGWGLAVCDNYVVSCGQDRALRLFEKTDEPLVLEDEREEEREREELLATGQESNYNLPSTKTVTAEKGADLLIECLEAIEKYNAELKAGEKPTPPPLMVALGASDIHDYLAKCLANIRSSDLGEALLLLPLHNVRLMLELMPRLLGGDAGCVEMAVRTLLLLLKVHHKPLSADIKLLPLLDFIQNTAFKSVTAFRDTVGVNLYGLKYVQREMEEREGVKMFADATQQLKEKQSKKRKKEKLKQASILAMT